MRDLKDYLTTHPGRITDPGGAHNKLIVPADEKTPFCGMSANLLSAMEGAINLLALGGGFGLNSTRYATTLDHTATITEAAGGFLFQTQASPTTADRVELISNRVFTPVSASMNSAGDFTLAPALVTAFTRIQVSDHTKVGFAFGLVDSGSAGVVAALPNDAIVFIAAANGALVGKTVENGGTAHATGTLLTPANATDYILGFSFQIGTSAANSKGYWAVCTGNVATHTTTYTPFTANQLADIFAMVAEAPTLSAYLGMALTGTSQVSMTAQYAWAEADR